MTETLTSEMVGRLLFGSYARLQLGIWIAELPASGPRRFCQAEYQAWCRENELTWQPIGAALRRFERLAMVQEEQPGKKRRPRYFLRLDSPLWGVFLIARSVINAACEEPVDSIRPSPSPMKMRAAAGRLLELREEFRTQC